MENEKKQEHYYKMLNLYCNSVICCNEYYHSNFEQKINCDHHKFKCDYYSNKYLFNENEDVYFLKSSKKYENNK